MSIILALLLTLMPTLIMARGHHAPPPHHHGHHHNHHRPIVKGLPSPPVVINQGKPGMIIQSSPSMQTDGGIGYILGPQKYEGDDVFKREK